MSDADLHTISTIENPAATNGRFTGGSSDDSSQSSATAAAPPPPPLTGLVQPQQPHWPQHNTTHNHHQLHSSTYLLDGDDDPNDLDYDDYGSTGPGTPGGPPSPVSSSGTRGKRGGLAKRISHSGTRKNGNYQ